MVAELNKAKHFGGNKQQHLPVLKETKNHPAFQLNIHQLSYAALQQ